jgi:hypothetical protein
MIDIAVKTGSAFLPHMVHTMLCPHYSILNLYNKFPCMNKDFPNTFLTQIFVCTLQLSERKDQKSCGTFLCKLVNMAHKIKYQIMWKHTICNIIREICKNRCNIKI